MCRFVRSETDFPSCSTNCSHIKFSTQFWTKRKSQQEEDTYGIESETNNKEVVPLCICKRVPHYYFLFKITSQEDPALLCKWKIFKKCNKTNFGLLNTIKVLLKVFT